MRGILLTLCRRILRLEMTKRMTRKNSFVLLVFSEDLTFFLFQYCSSEEGFSALNAAAFASG